MPPPSANVSRCMYDERHQYVKNISQIGIQWVDADDNDYMNSVFDQIRRVQQLIGNGSPNDGFKIVVSTAINDFKIKGGVANDPEQAGRIFVAGIQGLLDRDITYNGYPTAGVEGEAQRSIFPIITDEYYDSLGDTTKFTDSSANYETNELAGRNLQPDLENPGPAYPVLSNNSTEIFVSGDLTSPTKIGKPYRLLLTTPSVARTDYVYLNIFLDEIDATEDTNLLHNFGAPAEAQRRWKVRQFIHVRQGSATSFPDYEDVDCLKHFTLLLATIQREAGNPMISSDMIEDNRPIIYEVATRTLDRYYLTVSTNGQTLFPLPVIPNYPDKVFLKVQGVAQEYGLSKDYYVNGSNLIWLDRHFQLETTDVLEVWFLQ